MEVRARVEVETEEVEAEPELISSFFYALSTSSSGPRCLLAHGHGDGVWELYRQMQTGQMQTGLLSRSRCR